MMIKGLIHLLTIIMGIWVIGEPIMGAGESPRSDEVKSPKSNEVQIILYQKGRQKFLDGQSPHFQELLLECEDLFKTADDTYRLLLTKDLLRKIKKGVALEIIYPKVKTVILPFKQKPIYFTRLLIPLIGRFSNGTVFFAGISEYELKRDNPGLVPEQNYNYIDQYRGFNFVCNTQGPSKIKEICQKMSIKID